MAKGASKVKSSPGESVKPDLVEEKLDRADELCNKKAVREALLEIYKDIEKGFLDQADRSDDNMDWQILEEDDADPVWHSMSSRASEVPVDDDDGDENGERVHNESEEQILGDEREDERGGR